MSNSLPNNFLSQLSNNILFYIDPVIKRRFKSDWEVLKNYLKDSKTIDSTKKINKDFFYLSLWSENVDSSSLNKDSFNILWEEKAETTFLEKVSIPEVDSSFDLVYGEGMKIEDLIFYLDLAFFHWWTKQTDPIIRNSIKKEELLEKKFKELAKDSSLLSEREKNKFINYFNLVIAWANESKDAELKERFLLLDKKGEFYLIQEKNLLNMTQGLELLICKTSEREKIYIARDASEYSLFDDLRFYTLTIVMRLLLKTNETNQSQDQWITSLGDIFKILPFPIIVLSRDGKVIESNQAFSKMDLPPKACLKLKNDQEFELDNEKFVIKIVQSSIFDTDALVYYFLSKKPISKADLINTANELSVITGSLAHELNNPIAALLAGIEVLDPEANKRPIDPILIEMRETTLRSKKLIQTFLGFTKSQSINPGQTDDENVFEAFSQALNLIRSRLMELGIGLSFKKKRVRTFGYPLHSATMTMLFYLLVSEQLNLISHRKLLESQSTSELIWDIFLKEDTGKIEIECTPFIYQNWELSKLLLYLFNQQRLSFQFQENKVIIERMHTLF